MRNRLRPAWILVLLPITLLVLFSCSREKKQEKSTITPLTSKTLIKDARANMVTLAYDEHHVDHPHLLDFSLPPNGEPPFPMVVYVHGGGWHTGDKSPFPSVFLRSAGYATASINYRLSQDAPFPAQIEDCKQAIAFLRANAKTLEIDPARIGAWGGSAGGHLVALLGTTGDAKSPSWGTTPGTSNSVAAVCDWCGPSNLLSVQTQCNPRRNIMQPIAELLGGTPSEKPELAKEASPVNFAHKGCPPFLIMHGTSDDVVPIEQSRELSNALKAKGVDCAYEEVDGDHNIYTAENELRVTRFFDRYLKNQTSQKP